jgi:hypothetical protein
MEFETLKTIEKEINDNYNEIVVLIEKSNKIVDNLGKIRLLKEIANNYKKENSHVINE